MELEKKQKVTERKQKERLHATPMAAPYLTKAQTLQEKSSTSLDKSAGFMKHLQMQETLKPTGRLSQTFWGISALYFGRIPR